MKILLLSGSPRKNGNSSAMADAFTAGAESAGHEVVRFDVAKMNIAGCQGCEYCHTQGDGQCIQQDDMYEIYPHLMDCDAIVFASAVYYWTLTAQLQAALHRFYAIGKPAKAKKFAYMLSSGSPDVYDAIDSQMKDSFGFMGIEIAGRVVANDVAGENKSPAKLAECTALGANL
ncbi:MAG: flavodoxin family protein [Clostridia bacterium]|nr:flavodoxin family protein [Clostridia bacterium]